MNKKLIVIIIAVVLFFVGIYVITSKQQKAPLSTPLLNQVTTSKQAMPSETFLEYEDPSGFAFSYPDNISITKNKTEDESTYADLQLSSKEVNGSLSFRIVDSNYKTLDAWVKANTTTPQIPKETKLGNLKALEIKLSDRLLLGALDQGILFTIEIPAVEESFWQKVYQKLLTDFSFVAPKTATAPAGPATTSNNVVFEGEEIVE